MPKKVTKVVGNNFACVGIFLKKFGYVIDIGCKFFSQKISSLYLKMPDLWAKMCFFWSKYCPLKIGVVFKLSSFHFHLGNR